MPEITKTETRIHFSGAAFHVKQHGTEIEVGMCTEDYGPVKRLLTPAERVNLLQALDVKRDLAAGQDAIEENNRLRKKLHEALNSVRRLRRVLRLFRDFVVHGATQWKPGTNHHHPIWPLVAETLGAKNDDPPTQREWSFIWPGNTQPLDSQS